MEGEYWGGEEVEMGGCMMGVGAAPPQRRRGGGKGEKHWEGGKEGNIWNVN